MQEKKYKINHPKLLLISLQKEFILFSKLFPLQKEKNHNNNYQNYYFYYQ